MAILYLEITKPILLMDVEYQESTPMVKLYYSIIPFMWLNLDPTYTHSPATNSIQVVVYTSKSTLEW